MLRILPFSEKKIMKLICLVLALQFAFGAAGFAQMKTRRPVGGRKPVGKASTTSELQQLRAAVKANPSDATAHNALGLALAKENDLQAAAFEFNEAIRLKSDYAEAHANLGIALERQADFTNALAAFRRAAELAPNDAELHVSIASILTRTQNLEGAIDELKLAAKLNPNAPATRSNLGFLLAQKGDDNGAVHAAIVGSWAIPANSSEFQRSAPLNARG